MANITIPLETEDLILTFVGTGIATLEGVAQTADLSIEGVVNILAENLQTCITDVSIMGVSETLIAASDYLNVDIEGNGTVRYRGNPNVTQRLDSLLGSVEQIN